MPTSEERLTLLEQAFATFQKETATHIRDVEENTTILLGIVQSQGLDVKRAVQRLGVVEEHLSTLEQHMESRFETVNSRLDAHTALLNEHTGRFDHIETLLAQILGRLPEKP
jgi:hypothetical protein